MKSAQDALGRDGRPPLTPVAHGLPPDPSEWTDEQKAANTAAAIRRGDEAAERRRAENGGRLGGMLICNDTGNYLVTDDDTNDEEAFDREVPGSVEAMEIVERIRAADARHAQERAATMTPSRRPSCARRTVARIRQRARSGLGRGRPPGRRTRSASSSSGSDSEGESEPGEARPAAFLLAGPDRLLADIFSRLVGVVA
jgi:hypothetical protein